MFDQDERWLTYAEAGQLLGISSEAARAMARRNRWPRRTPNKPGTLAQVQVPYDRRPRPGLTGADRRLTGLRPGTADGHSALYDQDDRPDDAPDVLRSAVRALENAVDGLREQLAVANRRADAAEAMMRAEMVRRRHWWWRRK